MYGLQYTKQSLVKRLWKATQAVPTLMPESLQACHRNSHQSVLPVCQRALDRSSNSDSLSLHPLCIHGADVYQSHARNNQHSPQCSQHSRRKEQKPRTEHSFLHKRKQKAVKRLRRGFRPDSKLKCERVHPPLLRVCVDGALSVGALKDKKRPQEIIVSQKK